MGNASLFLAGFALIVSGCVNIPLKPIYDGPPLIRDVPELVLRLSTKKHVIGRALFLNVTIVNNSNIEQAAHFNPDIFMDRTEIITSSGRKAKKTRAVRRKARTWEERKVEVPPNGRIEFKFDLSKRFLLGSLGKHTIKTSLKYDTRRKWWPELEGRIEFTVTGIYPSFAKNAMLARLANLLPDGFYLLRYDEAITDHVSAIRAGFRLWLFDRGYFTTVVELRSVKSKFLPNMLLGKYENKPIYLCAPSYFYSDFKRNIHFMIAEIKKG